MEAKASPVVTHGRGSPAPCTPRDMNYGNNHPHATTFLPNLASGVLRTPAPATNLAISQTHPGAVMSGMAAGVQPAGLGRVVQPALTHAPMMMSAPGQPLRPPGPHWAPPGPHGAPPGPHSAPQGQPQRPGGGPVLVAGHAMRTGAGVAPQLALRPPQQQQQQQQQTFLTTPGGSGIPPGHTVMRDHKGQHFLVPHSYLAQLHAKLQMGVPNIHPRPGTPTTTMMTAARPAAAFQAIHAGPPPAHPPLPRMAGRNPAGANNNAHANQRPGSDAYGGGGGDDINDVASMAGVNISEESAQILLASGQEVGAKIRSCKDENLLATVLLHRRILQIARTFGVSEVPAEVVNLISQATQCRLSALLERVSAAARHRATGGGTADAEGGPYEQSSDVRAQLRFFKQLEGVEKQRKDEREREILRKAARSRARQEDPEQACLKQKAKEVQQQELALIQQHDANRAALDAIGTRRKRKSDSAPGASDDDAADSEVAPSARGQCSSAAGASRQKPRKQQVTRVNLWDFIFCVEQERPRSLLLYKALLGKAEKC